MSRPPFGDEPNRAICDLCREVVMRPVEYRGGDYHRGCAEKLRKQDLTVECIMPLRNYADRIVRDILDSNPPDLPGT